MSKKKILVLTSRYPYPVIGGDRLRIYNICKKLSAAYDITLLSLCDSKEELTMPLVNDGVFCKVERVYLPKWLSYLKTLKAVFSTTPLQVAYYSSRKFSKKVDQLLEGHDIALAHLVRVSEYLKNSSLPCILEMTDAISMNYERVKKLASSKGFMNVVYALEQKRLNHYEKNIVSFYDLSVLISDVDRKYLFSDEAYKDKVVVFGNGVDLANYPFSGLVDSSRLVFIGNMDTVQNFDAAYWFATKVLPKINIGKNHFKFEVIGRISDANKKRLLTIADVNIVGSVEKISDHTKGALAGICSMRLGAGVQNKVLEYMALGLPSVISPVAAEGLSGNDGEHYFVAYTVEDYVSIVNGLVENLELARNVAVSARQLIETEYDWGKILSDYKNHVDLLVDLPPRYTPVASL